MMITHEEVTTYIKFRSKYRERTKEILYRILTISNDEEYAQKRMESIYEDEIEIEPTWRNKTKFDVVIPGHDGYESFGHSFPVEYLWDEDWEEKFAEKYEMNKIHGDALKEDESKNLKMEREISERRQYEKLKAKYETLKDKYGD